MFGEAYGSLKKTKTLLEIIGDGQLCFFSIALVAVTINDISNMGSEKRNTAWAISYLRWAEPTAYLIIIIIVFVFGLIVSENTGSTAASDKRRLTLASVVLTVVALMMIYIWRFNLELF